MTKTPDRETITKALAEATPGPWKWTSKLKDDDVVILNDLRYTAEEVWGARIIFKEPDPKDSGRIACGNLADAHLIANAPEWLRYLLNQLDAADAELAKQAKEIAEWRKHAEDFEEMYKQEHRAANRLRDYHNALAEVLAWYADEDIWSEDAEGFVDFSIAESDAGQSARICLSSLKEAAI